MTAGHVLGVASSVTGRAWVGIDPAQDRAAEALAQSTGLPQALCRHLARRGVAAEEVESFLAPKLRDLLPDPLSLRDMSPAATRLLRAVERREKIAVFADYDVDGGSSAALLIWWLRDLGLGATLFMYLFSTQVKRKGTHMTHLL